MARDEEQMIGFDPLAWMDESDQDKGKTPAMEQSAEDTGKSDVPSENEADKNKVNSEETEIDIKQPTISTQEYNDVVAGEGQVKLEAEMNIQKVAELHKTLIEVLEQNDLIEIDAQAVKTIDTATLQLLVVLKQEAVKLHKNVVISASERFVESANLLGIGQMLEVA